jgi:hypothetical protein
MHSDQFVYAELHDALLEYDKDSPYADLLAPWLRAQADEREWLRSFSERQGNPIPPAEIEDLWRLYALSRVFDLLLLRFQPRRVDGADWAGPPISLGEYEAFAEALGFVVARPPGFSPFYHEVVDVEPALDPAQPARVLEFRWPCVMLGHMLFSRAGVRVSAGRDALLPGVADLSTLYWAYRRRNRPVEDLSLGWGHASQWRTTFRRDYRVGEALHYNVDGNRDLDRFEPDDRHDADLNREERIELLTNRCFVTATKPHNDRWPYHDTLRVENGTRGT